MQYLANVNINNMLYTQQRLVIQLYQDLSRQLRNIELSYESIWSCRQIAIKLIIFYISSDLSIELMASFNDF